ncbi:MAG: hemolysin family protein [Dehalococcoidia bacterium]
MLDIPGPAFTSTLLGTTSLNIPLPLAIALFVGGLVGYAAVNAIEIAVIASNRIRVRAAAEKGSHRAAAILRLKEEQDMFFGLVVILQNVFVFLASTAGTVIGVQQFGTWGYLVSLIAIPLISAEFGEYTPKVIASRAAERIAFAVAFPVELLARLMKPVAVALATVPNLFSSVEQRHTISEAELRMLIDISAEEGAVGEEEAELLDRVFHFHDRRAREIMIPRTEITWLEKQETVREFYETFDKTPHSRFPVYDDSVDNVVGTVSIKDVLRALAQHQVTEASPIEPMIRPALFIPESKLVSELFAHMQAERYQMAVVVDEYGGVAGIVTVELLLEEMVGVVGDELAQGAEEYLAIDEKTTRIDGGMSVYDLHEELGLDLPEGDYETIAGYVLDQLGHIPREGETITLDGFRIAVSEVKGVKIESVVVTKLT